MMSLLKTASLAVLFGSLYTVFRKYQSVVELPETPRFNHPILQSFIIFVGMTSIIVLRPWLRSDSAQKSERPSDNMLIYIVPSLLDVLGTIVDTAGLYYTSVSVSQMLKGSVLFFTYLITLFYLRRKLSLRKHLYMGVVLSSLALVGASNLYEEGSKFESNPLLGNTLIVVSQFLFSLMFIYEEQILQRYEVRVENAVFWEGIWGVLISGFVLTIFSNVSAVETKVFESCLLICSDYRLLTAVLLTALCIGPFNYFGISLTKQGSALQRCIICTARMIVVWSVSLIFGWEQFRWMQLLGYSTLTWAIYKFNQPEGVSQNAEMDFDEQTKLRIASEKEEQ